MANPFWEDPKLPPGPGLRRPCGTETKRNVPFPNFFLSSLRCLPAHWPKEQTDPCGVRVLERIRPVPYSSRGVCGCRKGFASVTLYNPQRTRCSSYWCLAATARREKLSASLRALDRRPGMHPAEGAPSANQVHHEGGASRPSDGHWKGTEWQREWGRDGGQAQATASGQQARRYLKMPNPTGRENEHQLPE